jgi:hypothetical protein
MARRFTSNWDITNVPFSFLRLSQPRNVRGGLKHVLPERPPNVGKSTFFFPSPFSLQPAAILSSLTSTCRRHAIDPQRYLTQLLTNLPATPISKISEWLTDEWRRRTPSPSG